jgi:flavodoxin
MGKTLVLYYSFEGNTKRVAEWIGKSLGVDIARIEPEKELSSKGFSKFIWGGSQVVMKKKPKIKPLVVDLSQYDTILLGSPIWAGTFAPPVYTLLGDGMLKEKRIGYFYTHLGGAGKAVEKAKVEIIKENQFVSSIECENVEKNFESIKEKLIIWAKSVVGE